MQIIPVTDKDKKQFSALAPHPLQSWEWGDFRRKLGTEVIRLGTYKNGTLTEAIQMTIHPIPFTSRTIGYIPKSNIPSASMLKELASVGKQYKCVFIKFEPNILHSHLSNLNNLSDLRIKKSPHPLFTKYTFQLDLTKSEEELLKDMNQKTRYNIKIAKKHGVVIKEDDSPDGFEEYLRLTFETTKRQKFYAHNEKYHRLMWETLRTSKIAHLFTANYQHEGKNHILVTWIVFLFNGVLYYPYGASSSEFRNVMASNLMMWEVIRWGKAHGAKLFDMWGALGPDPDPKDSWIGFHRFKQGYGSKHVEFAGSYDLVLSPLYYGLYNTLYILRELFLKIKSILRG